MIKFLSMPYLVQKAVLERMGLIELFDLTRISKRIKNKVKHLVRIQNVKLVVFAEGGASFKYVLAKDNAAVCTFVVIASMYSEPDDPHRNIGDLNNVASAISPPRTTDDHGWMLIFYLDDYFLGARALYKELVKIFSITAKHGDVNLNTIGNDRFVVIPKKGSVFRFIIGDRLFSLFGDGMRTRPAWRGKKPRVKRVIPTFIRGTLQPVPTGEQE